MRLTGIEIPPAITGGEAGFLKFGSICVLLGANDSGKSRILGNVARALDSRFPTRLPAAERPRVFVELERSLATWLDEEFSSAPRRPLPLVEGRSLFGRPLAGDDSEAFVKQMRSARLAHSQGLGLVEERLLFFRAWAGLDDPHWDPLFVTLADSQHALIRPVAHGWTIEWCLPSPETLDPDVCELLMELDLFPEPWRPIPATPLLPWVLGDRGLPQIRLIPMEDPPDTLEMDADIRQDLEACPEDVPPDVWSSMVRRLFQRMTTARLPSFITTEYDVTTDPQGTTFFSRRRGGNPLTATKVADGYRIWIELALIDASETLTDTLAQVRAILGLEADWPNRQGSAAMLLHLESHGGSFLNAVASDHEATADLLAELAPLLAREWHAREAYSYAGSSREDPMTITAGTREQPALLFVIDEPERHLHPGLQRQAAAWLQQVADKNLLYGQILTATHSVSLMGLTRSVEYAEVRRPATATIIVPVARRQRDALDALSGELGIDRGELITLSRVFLFVEGAVDKVVFEEVFGDRLRDAGIEVLAMHGTKKMQAVIESDLLFTKYRQRIAVIVDNIVQEQLPRANDIEALTRLCSKPGTDNQELRKAAELLKNARHAGREVMLNAIPRQDMIAELDAEVIREVQDTLYPGYEASSSARRRSGSNRSWKAFCVEWDWFRPDVDDIQPVAAEMRRRGICPPDLERLVTWVERLAEKTGP